MELAHPGRHRVPDYWYGFGSFPTMEEASMSTATLTGQGVTVREAVMRELEMDPRLDASGIGVSAKGAAVTLGGFVDPRSMSAEKKLAHPTRYRGELGDFPHPRRNSRRATHVL